jgi:hypothetical protein
MYNKFPIQKVSSAGKTKKWFKDSVIYGVDMALNENNAIKPDNKTIKENFRLYNGDRDSAEIKKNFDSVGLIGAQYSPSFRNFSTIRDRIDELVGEYIEKGVEYVIAAIDRDAINAKITEQREMIREAIQEIITNQEITSREAIQERLERVVNFKFMSKAEVAANKLLDYLKKANGLMYKEIEGFRNALITAAVFFDVNVRNKKLIIDLHSPDMVYAVRSGYSNDVRDSEIITVLEFLPPSRIIDRYSEFLKDKDVKDIIEGNVGSGMQGMAELNAKRELVFHSQEDLERFTRTNMSDGSQHGGTEIMDNDGNIRVATVKWIGYRNAYNRKYYDELSGEVQYDYVSEIYKANKAKGEELTVRWFPEVHVGTLIGADKVIDAKVAEYQFNSTREPSRNISGFVGGYFNVGNEKAKSLVDYTKSYLYLRDSIFARIEDLMSKNIGKAIELDLAKKPKSWSVKKVLYYLKRYGIMVVNSFNEGTKGKSQGKLIGQYNQGGSKVLDAELGISIRYMMELLQLVDTMIARSTGVTDQRLGAINTRELVGNVERSRIQSSLITEIWFNRYEQIILDLYSTILEVGKRTIDDDERLQFVLDDTSYAMIKDGLKELKSTKLGLFPVNSVKYAKLKNVLEQLAIQAIPNGNMSVEQLISLYDSNSMAEMIDKQYAISAKNKKIQMELEKAREAAKLKEVEMTKQLEENQARLEHNFDMQVEKLRGDYKVLIKKMEVQDSALSDHIKAISSITSDSIKQGIEGDKLRAQLEQSKIT